MHGYSPTCRHARLKINIPYLSGIPDRNGEGLGYILINFRSIENIRDLGEILMGKRRASINVGGKVGEKHKWEHHQKRNSQRADKTEILGTSGAYEERGFDTRAFLSALRFRKNRERTWRRLWVDKSPSLHKTTIHWGYRLPDKEGIDKSSSHHHTKKHTRPSRQKRESLW